MNISWLVVGSALVVGGACSKQEAAGTAGSGSAAAGDTTGKVVEAKPDRNAPPRAFAAWKVQGANLAWEQNAWASRMQLRTSGTMSMAGDPVAIEIKGDKARVWDGKAEHQLGFRVESPCSVEFTKEITEGSMKGGKQNMGKMFVMSEGKFLVSDYAMGYRKGQTAFVCGGGSGADFVTLDDKGACKGWSDFGGTWESKDLTCAWTQVDGKDALKIGDGSTTVIADGDLLISESAQRSIKEGYHAPAKSWDEARAAVDALVKAKDPGEIAKAAGGKVGETSTVASLAATFAADRKTVEGKEVEVTALYLNSNASTSNGATTYNVVAVDKQGDMKLTLSCYVDAEVKGLKQYDKIKLKGTVGESFDAPKLDKCTVAKAK